MTYSTFRHEYGIMHGLNNINREEMHMEQSRYAPIALFVYNRYEHTKKMLASLLQNEEASHSELYIFSDAPQREIDAPKVALVRELVSQLSGFKNIHITYRDQNIGLAGSIISGVSTLCERYGKVIVLEDDLLLSPYFLRYMNQGLDCYENDTQVGSIHGYTYPVTKTLPDTFFIRGGDCWGWATWQRAWQHFEEDGSILKKALANHNLIHAFNFNGQVDNYQMLLDQIQNKNNSWAIRWHASLFLKDMLTLYPSTSLVQNIGNDSTGQHSMKTDCYAVELSSQPIQVTRLALQENPIAVAAFETYFKSIKPSRFRQFISKLKQTVFAPCV